jgi:tetratricopeptide (TPR) repeat protein
MRPNLFKSMGLLAILFFCSAAAALPQAGHGIGRIGGAVVDLDGKPLEGVKVTIVFSLNEQLKFEVTTNAKGEWSFLGLGTGNWNMTAKAAGYMPITQALYVNQLGVNPKVTVKIEKMAPYTQFALATAASFAILEKGNQLFKEGKYDEAIASFQEFFEKNSTLYQVQLNLGDCYREKGEYDKAIETYTKVIEQSKTDLAGGMEINAKALAGIGNCYLKQKKLAEAQDYFKKSIDSSPKDEILAYNVGEIFFANQEYDEALRYFELAVKIRPDWPDSYLKAGYVYLNKADNPKAVEKFEKFLTLEPEGERAALARNILNAIKKSSAGAPRPRP